MEFFLRERARMLEGEKPSRRATVRGPRPRIRHAAALSEAKRACEALVNRVAPPPGEALALALRCPGRALSLQPAARQGSRRFTQEQVIIFALNSHVNRLKKRNICTIDRGGFRL